MRFGQQSAGQNHDVKKAINHLKIFGNNMNKHNFLDFELSPCSECCMLSFG